MKISRWRSLQLPVYSNFAVAVCFCPSGLDRQKSLAFPALNLPIMRVHPVGLTNHHEGMSVLYMVMCMLDLQCASHGLQESL